MFTLTQTPVTFVGLLLLFAWCVVWGLWEVTRPGSGRERGSAVLNLLMSVVMLLMVAPPTWQALVAVAPTAVWAGVFALSAAWFGWWAVAAFRQGERPAGWHGVGHATMFVAMAWHLAAMASMASMHAHGMDHHGVDHHGAGHDGADEHGGTGHHDGMGHPGGHDLDGGPDAAWWFALAGVPLMAYLLGMGLWALGQVLRRRGAQDAEPGELGVGHTCAPVVGTAGYRLAMATDAAMHLGMFWMSTGLLAPLIPALRLLSFGRTSRDGWPAGWPGPPRARAG